MGKPSVQKIYEFGEFRLDTGHRMLYRGNDEIPLAPKAVETLLALIERRGEIVGKDELLEIVWPDAIVEESNLFLYLSVLRKKLGNQENGDPWVETLRRRGYRFSGNIRLIQDSADSHYAWVVDNPKENEANVETSSGRLYILKDWDGDKFASRQTQAVPKVRPIEAADMRTDEAVPSPLARSEGPAVKADPKPKNRTRLMHWFIAASIAVVSLAAGLFLYRSNTRNEVAPNKDVSIIDLSAGDDVLSPTISRDGKLFAYHTDDNNRQRLMLQQIGQLNPKELFSSTGLQIHIKAFSPDDEYIYFSGRENEESALSVYKIPTFGGSIRKILTGISGQSSVSFSPDGSEFVFARPKNEANEYSITIARTDGSEQRDVLSSSSEELAYPAWSPDGKSIAFARYFTLLKAKRHFSIDVLSPNGGPAQRLFQESLDTCFRIAWTSNGEGLVFDGTKLGDAMTRRRDQLWFVSLSSQKMTRLTPEGVRYSFGGLTHDNAAIVNAVARDSQIWIMEATGDSRTAVQLTRGTSDGRTGITPLPDGRVGYTIRNGDNWEIWIMYSDGSGAKQVHNDNANLDEVRATPDGKYFVFTAITNGNSQLFRLNTEGGGLKQLTFSDETYVGDLSPASDSSSVIYHGTLFRDYNAPLSYCYSVPIDGGEPVQVEGTRYSVTPHYSPDGRYISYIDQSRVPMRLAVQATDDAANMRFFDISRTMMSNIGAIWTPDGRSLAYIVYQNKASNIWLQPIDGGPPRQLTDFTSGHIYRIAYSRDGKHIYMARGYATNNALLIKGFVD